MTILAENYSLARWARELGVSPNAVSRWRTEGLLKADGTREYLNAFKCGGRWRVSRESMDLFLANLNQQADGSVSAATAPRSPSEARKADERAVRELTAFGFGV
jgi:hypothetical protein